MDAATGAALATQLYAPYGGVRYQSGTLPTDHGFTGQVSDAASSGLDDYGARSYDPVAGQFTSADTTLAGGLNRYAYVGGNPESKTDPSGHIQRAPRDYNHVFAYQQESAAPHVYYGDPNAVISDTMQFFFGTDTLRQSYYTLFLDRHASTGDKVKAAAAAALTVVTDAVTIASTFAGDPEVGGAARTAEGALLAAEDAGHAAALAAENASKATSVVGEAESQTTRLWRAVEPGELADVQKYGDYNIHPNSTFKRFAFSEEDLDHFIKASPNQNYTKTYIDLPSEKLDLMYRHPDAGGVGNAIGIDVYATPEFYEWFDTVHIVDG